MRTRYAHRSAPPSRFQRATPPLAEELESQGYVILKDLTSPDDIAALRAVFPAGECAERTIHVDGLDDHPSVQRLFACRELHETLTFLLGASFDLSRVHGREPGKGGGAQGLHADAPAPLGKHDAAFATLLAFLDAADAQNGATRVLPGSHRARHLPDRRTADPAFSHVAEVRIDVRPGDVLLFNALLWHSGTRNVSGQRRRAIQCSLTRAGHAADLRKRQ